MLISLCPNYLYYGNRPMWYHSHSPKTKRPIRRVRPALQTLEDRMTPALIYVNTLEDVVADDGKRSLREAIDLANRTPTPDTIVLKAGQYQITRPGSDNANQTGDFDVTGHVTIIGQGASKTGINGAQIDRLFDLIGPINVNFANLTLWNGRVLLGNGGCIQALDANIKMANCFVIDNQAVWGGGISTTNGNVTLINSFAARNFAGADGGGIHSDNGTLTLRNSSVHDNQAGDEGGGINAVSGKVTLTGSTLTGNVANQDGGGINLGTGALIMNNCRVLNNRAYGKGGGIGSQSEAILTNSTVGGNYSDGVGGGIHAAAVSLTKSNVRGNAARLMGGGISAGTASLMTSTVRDNVAMGGGGGIYASAEATLARSSVIGNSSLGGGGGIMVWTGPAKLTNSFVRGNSALS
jgi:CSLREA domain-containing protein